MARFAFPSECKVPLRVAGAVLSLAAAGCAPFARPTLPPGQLGGETPIAQPSALQRNSGSLWRDNLSSSLLLTDTKARYPGDLITVLVVEDDSGSKEAQTSATTKSSVSQAISGFFGLPQELQKKNPNIDPASLVAADTSRDWKGDGKTSRTGKLKATVTWCFTKM